MLPRLKTTEKRLVLAILLAFIIICFSSVLFLPDKAEESGGFLGGRWKHDNKVYKIYQQLGKAGNDFILPPPPTAVPIKTDRNNRPFPANNWEQEDASIRRQKDQKRIMDQIELDPEIIKIKKQISDPKSSELPPKPLSLSPELKPDGNDSPHPSVAKHNAENDVTGGLDRDVADKREHVKNMMIHAWNGYATYAWGFNEVKPISKSPHGGSVFGNAQMGATIVDSLDTLYIMGLEEQFQDGRKWIEEFLNFNFMKGEISVFETNIRYVGGLVSAYALTGDEMFKRKAVHVADKLLPAFSTPTGIPYSLVNMRTGAVKNFFWASGGSSILSEIGTLHMEFAYLSDITGDPKYSKVVMKIREVLKSLERPGGLGLYPNYVSPKTGKWGSQHTSIGALGDSFYEYLLKEWLRSGKKDLESKDMFDEAALAIEKHLVKTSKSGLVYLAESKYGKPEHKMDHLACFAGGMYGLAAHEERDENSQRWMNIGAGIAETCHETYRRSDTKLGPEAFRFADALEGRALKTNEKVYMLRPETFETYFIMWRLTHDQKYRDWGWEAVLALDKHCKSEGGYSGIKNVYSVNSPKDDVQQSFFLAETLKYLYLLFSSDDLISLDKWVFNTEAHPLPIKDSNQEYYRASNAGLNTDTPTEQRQRQ